MGPSEPGVQGARLGLERCFRLPQVELAVPSGGCEALNATGHDPLTLRQIPRPLWPLATAATNRASEARAPRLSNTRSAAEVRHQERAHTPRRCRRTTSHAPPVPRPSLFADDDSARHNAFDRDPIRAMNQAPHVTAHARPTILPPDCRAPEYA